MRDGTLRIQRRYRGLKHINVRSGVRDKRTRDRILSTMDSLYDRGRLDLLEDVRTGILAPLQLYNAQQEGKTKTLPTSADIKPLKPHLFDWLDSYEIAESTRRGYRDRFNNVLKLGKDSPTVSDLPDLLDRMRTKQKKLGQHRSFNLARSAVMAYLRSTLSRHHPVYQAVTNLEPLDGKPKRQGNPLSIVDALAIRDKLKQPMASMWWSMCLSGMGPTEYYGRWEVEGEVVLIHGEKREGRDRTIPKLWELVRPTCDYKHFRQALRTASKRMVQPYDARRTFSRLLSEAEVWPVHRAIFMGHGQKNMTDYYASPKMAATMLETDRVKIAAYLKQESRKRVNPLADRFFTMED